jgi:hypothetical protein
LYVGEPVFSPKDKEDLRKEMEKTKELSDSPLDFVPGIWKRKPTKDDWRTIRVFNIPGLFDHSSTGLFHKYVQMVIRAKKHVKKELQRLLRKCCRIYLIRILVLKVL